MSARVTSAVLLSAIRRLAEREGGFATVLTKGDPTAGAILLEIRQRGDFAGLFERMPALDGGANWIRLKSDDESRAAYLAKRLQHDPDLSIVELDVPDATQFIPQLPSGT